MAVKRPDLMALPDKIKDALRLVNATFPVDWDGVLITKGADEVAGRIELLRNCELQYYKQNLPKTLVSVNERYETERKQRQADEISRKLLKEETKTSTHNKQAEQLKKQVSMCL